MVDDSNIIKASFDTHKLALELNKNVDKELSYDSEPPKLH